MQALAGEKETRSRFLAEGGPYTLGDKSADAIRGARPVSEVSLDFVTERPHRVVVEAEGLKHVDLGANAAPEVFLDEEFLGALQPGQGLEWRGLREVELAPGRHGVVVRNAASAEAEDCVLGRLLVYDVGPQPTPRPAAQAKAARPCGCRDLARREDWPRRLEGRGLTLSVLSGRAAASGRLATLRDPDAWACEVRVPTDKGEPLPLGLRLESPRDGVVALAFARVPEPPGRRQALNYEPEAWQPLSVELCQGRLKVRFAQAPAFEAAVDAKGFDFEVLARDCELSLRPLPGAGAAPKKAVTPPFTLPDFRP